MRLFPDNTRGGKEKKKNGKQQVVKAVKAVEGGFSNNKEKGIRERRAEEKLRKKRCKSAAYKKGPCS